MLGLAVRDKTGIIFAQDEAPAPLASSSRRPRGVLATSSCWMPRSGILASLTVLDLT